MIKREAKFQTTFNRWLKYVYLPKQKGGGYAFELKSSREESISFSALRPHQKDYLLAAKRSSIVHKIADDSIGYKPFDCFAVKGGFAYVVIQYPGGTFYLIDIEDWVAEEGRSKRRSLTEKRAKEISTLEVNKGTAV